MRKEAIKLMGMVAVPSEIWTGHLPNTSENFTAEANLLSNNFVVAIESEVKAMLLSPVKCSSFTPGLNTLRQV
jgi:hypothetical protein